MNKYQFYFYFFLLAGHKLLNRAYVLIPFIKRMVDKDL